jgi:hypothetical protein
METRTEAQLTALLMDRVRQHRECDNVMSAAIIRPLQKNWDVEWVVDGPQWTPLKAWQIARELQIQFRLAEPTSALA